MSNCRNPWLIHLWKGSPTCLRCGATKPVPVRKGTPFDQGFAAGRADGIGWEKADRRKRVRSTQSEAYQYGYDASFAAKAAAPPTLTDTAACAYRLRFYGTDTAVNCAVVLTVICGCLIWGQRNDWMD